AVRSDGQGGKIAAAVIGHERPFPAGIDRDIAGVITAACLSVDECEFTGGFVEGECAHATRHFSVRLVEAVNEVTARGYRQVGRVVRHYRAYGRRITGSGVETIYVDPFASF